MNVVVFDIDGTIADNSHRRVHLMGDKKDWKSYNATMIDDGVFVDIAQLLVDLSEKHYIILCTAREEVYRSVTWTWLENNGLSDYIHDLWMRNEKDYRSDAVVKVELLNDIIGNYGKPWLWFDDRQQVVDAIRAEGIRVMQVAPGNF
jgi:FMN phosphatase YigB (HAD superfamily)